MLLDPDYEFTNLYGLRWDAPRETAYPSTFLIDGHGVIFFSKIVKEHGGRTTAAEILDACRSAKPGNSLLIVTSAHGNLYWRAGDEGTHNRGSCLFHI